MIGPTAKLVYGRLCQYAGEKGRCWPSIQTIANAVGCSRTTVKKAIKELQDAKLIEVEHRNSEDGDSASNCYYFLDHEALHIYALRGGQVYTPPQAKSVRPGPETAPKENHLKKAINLNSSSKHICTKTTIDSSSRKPYPIPSVIMDTIQILPFAQNHLKQVCILVSRQLSLGTPEKEALACLIVFKDRLPSLRNKHNPCSLLAKLFEVEAGKEYLEIMLEAESKTKLATKIKAQEEAQYANEQARLSQEAEEWVKTEAGKRISEILNSKT